MEYDIIIYAVVAVLVLARLWSVLGQRNDGERERPNPFATPPADPAPARTDSNVTRTDIPLLPKPVTFAPASLAGGLVQIKEADAAFDEKQFLQGARSAFTLILNDFAKGDLAESTHLLGPTVLPHFRNALAHRSQSAQTVEHKLVSIREAECTAAKTENSQASITVRFVSEQQRVVRDAHSQIVEGAEGQVEEVIDLWTFAREMKSSNPNWVLVETRP